MKIVNRIKIQWFIPLLMALVFFHAFRSFALEDTNEFSWLKLVPPVSFFGCRNAANNICIPTHASV
jgi:hypothetical protein